MSITGTDRAGAQRMFVELNVRPFRETWSGKKGREVSCWFGVVIMGVGGVKKCPVFLVHKH